MAYSNKLPYTAESISQDSEKELCFSIPLYQRLFEWGDDQIKQLLDDLRSSQLRNENEQYYIGMLTAKENGLSIELVDGQQRFTAMVLLGIHFGGDQWKEFLVIKDSLGTRRPRLQFSARDDDEKYLMAKIDGIPIAEGSYKNEKMEKGLSCIESHIHKELKMDNEQERKFGEFIFKRLTFFISYLPKEYNSHELNTYFERMNTSGKSLENYEILKVDVIRKLSSDKEMNSRLWNAISIMEKKILRVHHKETLDALRNRYLEGLLALLDTGSIEGAFESKAVPLNPEYEDVEQDEEAADAKDKLKSIKDIDVNPENPFRIIKRRTEEHAMLSFPELLLQVLYICLGQDIDAKEVNGKIVEGINVTDFFDVRKLGQSFKWALDKRGVDANDFMKELAICRLLMDYFVIRVDDEDEEPYPFEMYSTDENSKASVKRYLSMLYSASSAMTYYMWFPDLMLYLKEFVIKYRSLNLDGSTYLVKLKEIDNKWHPQNELVQENLTYETIDRYWFWRIDYYLWENRGHFFKDGEMAAVDNYIFRRNRSIEHIAPQHPKDDFGDKTKFCWSEDDNPELAEKRDCLGNMVMISSGQNSSLTNSCFEVKHAVMQKYIAGSGHVESLKMLYVYSKYNEWSIDNIKEHKEFSLDFLKASYLNDNSVWEELAK